MGKDKNSLKSILRRRYYYLFKFKELKEVFESLFCPLEDNNVDFYNDLEVVDNKTLNLFNTLLIDFYYCITN
jgi:hypothetical protein